MAMLDMAAGGEGRFRERPFCHMSSCYVVPPLRFAQEACETLEKVVRLGLPVILLCAGQAGATSPAALAGAAVQEVAEALAGVVYVNLISPGHPILFGAWPFVSDLRTGAIQPATSSWRRIFWLLWGFHCLTQRTTVSSLWSSRWKQQTCRVLLKFSLRAWPMAPTYCKESQPPLDPTRPC